MLTRLLVGLVCWGSEDLRHQSLRWEGTFPDRVEGDVTPGAVLIGLAFEGPELLAQTFADLREHGERLGMRFLQAARPVLHSRLGAPVVRRFERARERLEAQARRLAEVGRIEEVRSRAQARRGVRKAVDGLWERLEGAAQMRELVVVHGVTLAGELMEALQERTELVDGRVERFVRSLFRGRTPPREVGPSQQEHAPSPVVFPTRPVPAHM